MTVTKAKVNISGYEYRVTYDATKNKHTITMREYIPGKGFSRKKVTECVTMTDALAILYNISAYGTIHTL